MQWQVTDRQVRHGLPHGVSHGPLHDVHGLIHLVLTLVHLVPCSIDKQQLTKSWRTRDAWSPACIAGKKGSVSSNGHSYT